MIHIDRTRIPPPPGLLAAAEREAEEARSFYLDRDAPRYKKPFKHTAYHARGVSESVLELFHDKCAFCESKLGSGMGLEIEQFRPKDMAVNHDGSVQKPGYWWLAYEWANLYPVCPLCNRTKASRFPVVGRRAEFAEAGSRRQAITLREGPWQAVAVTAGGQVAVAASQDARLEFWRLESGKLEATVQLETSPLADFAATPDGRVITLAYQDGNLMACALSKRFSVREVYSLLIMEELGKFGAVAIRSDGKLVAAALGTTIVVWELGKEPEMRQLTGHADLVKALTFTPDGHRLVSAGEDGTLGVWDLESGAELRTLVGEVSLAGLGLTADGKRAVSLSSTGVLQVWDLESGSELFKVAGNGVHYQALSLSAEGRYAICLGSQGVRVVDLYTRQERAHLRFSGPQARSAAVTPDGSAILTLDEAGVLGVWNLDPVGSERSLLLDPCQDDPTQYLIYSTDGYVASVPPDSESVQALDGKRFEGLNRGQITIDTFGLNRVDLVEYRQRAAQQLQEQVRSILTKHLAKAPSSPTIDQDILDELLSAHHAFAAMRRQLLPKFVEELRDQFQDVDLPFVPDFIQQKLDQYIVENQVVEKAFANLENLSSRRMATTLEDEKTSEIFLRSALVSRVEIRNYRCLEDLAFEFTGGAENRVNWKVLLGENGVGKSSVLEAVALALMGKHRLEMFGDIDPGTLLKRGTDSGYVRVYFSTDPHPIELKLTPSGPEFPTPESALRTYLLGFGSARWLPREGSSEEPENDPYVRVRNLFNPFIPLTDAIKWLRNLKNKREIKKYQKVESVLARLMQKPPGTRFPLRAGVIYVQRPEDESIAKSERLDELSDGYQTILAIAVAIMDMLGDRWNMEMEAAEGFVLLDEIGSHLHPRWKLRIVDSLRSAFPRMQFLATTHEPLCLRGLYNKEVIILQRTPQNKTVVIDEDLPAIEGLRVDQLLTSEYFGLDSTIDPVVDNLFQEYYRLLALRARTSDQEAGLQVLKAELEKYRVLGITRRERIMLEAVDEYLAQEPRLESLSARQDLKEETKQKVVEMWAKVRQKSEVGK